MVPAPHAIRVVSRGQEFDFDAGALCLEFLLSGGEGWLARFEQLHQPRDLERWARTSRLWLPAGPPSRVDVTAADLRHARVLREAVRRLVEARIDGTRCAALMSRC